MKKLICIVVTAMLLLSTFAFVGCNKKVEFDYVIDLGTYTSLDYDLARRHFVNSGVQGGGCTAVAKYVNGKMLVGRNMDLNTSNNPAFVYRTNVRGFYKTISLTYSYSSGPTYQEYLDSGIDTESDFYKLIPFMATDVLNNKGLYVETNMRYDEYNDDGSSRFGCTGTNPGKERVYALCVPRYVGERCGTVAEAKALIDNLDIYTDGNKVNWNLCFMIADAQGNYGVMEIAQNKAVWNDKAPAQTNFYITEEFAEISEYGSGYGRYDVITDGLESVTNADEMFDLINKVSYSQMYRPNPQFDVRSEFVDHTNQWTSAFLLDEANSATVNGYIQYVQQKYAEKNRQQLQDINVYWESTFTIVVNCNKKTMKVRFFEDDNRVVTLSF